MIITEQAMFDYIYCPAKYDIKYNKKIDIETPTTFNKLLNIAAKNMYITLLRGKVPTMSATKQKWDSICKANQEFIDTKKGIQGISLLNQLYGWAYKNKICIQDVDTAYTYVVDGVQLAGVLNPILINASGKTEILTTDFNARMKDRMEIDMNLKMTIDSMAYGQIYNEAPNSVKYLNVKADKEVVSYRTEPDCERMKSTIKGVAAGIQAKAYYPRESVLCQTCTAKSYCRYWHK
jgi:hypothetical protein